MFDNYRALLRRSVCGGKVPWLLSVRKPKQLGEPDGATSDSAKPQCTKTVKSTKLQDPMSFHARWVDATCWLIQVVKLLWKVQPRTTTLTIGSVVLIRFTKLAAFLLPLKVLLLAASDRVPRYFSGVADQEAKLYWIIGLSLAAVALYFVSRFLQSLSVRLSEAGSQEVMKQANQLALLQNQNEVGRRHFTEITSLCASCIFFVAALIIISIINLPLAIFVMVLLVVEYGVTSLLVDPKRTAHSIAKQISERPDNYIDELYIVSFWLVFVFILAPFLAGAGSNALVAIVSFLLIRQALNAVSTAISSAVDLVRKRSAINALTSPSHQWQRSDSRTRKVFRSDFESFRVLFEKRAHLAKLESVLSEGLGRPRPTAVTWKDSPVSGLTTFTLTIRSGPAERYYQEQVFAPHQTHLLQNEEILFHYVARDTLGAPAVLQNFTYGPYQCRLCDYGSGTLAPAKGWFEGILQRIWTVQPPDGLVLAFNTSHSLIHERLTSEFVGRLGLAVTTKRQAKTLRSLQAELSFIRAALSELPLCLSTRDMSRSNTALQEDGETTVMMWGRWTLEPIGSSLPSKFDDSKLSTMIERARQSRSDISDTISPDHLRLAAACQALEKKIADVKYEAALHLLPTILRNSALVGKRVEATARTSPSACTRSSPPITPT